MLGRGRYTAFDKQIFCGDFMQAKFSPSDAAISIFGFIKANPQFTYRYIAISAVVGLLNSFALAAAGLFAFLERFTEISKGSSPPSSSEMMAAVNMIKLPHLAIFAIISTFVTILVLGMALRKTVLNKEIGFYGLSWGNDENQLALVAMVSPFLAVLFFVAFVLFMVFLLGRCGMFGVYTIVNQKASLAQTARETKEQFWSFVGAYFLAWVICFIVVLVMQALTGLALRPLMGDVGASGYPTDFKGTFSIGAILYFALNGAFAGVFQLALVCVGAFAYHKMNEALPATINPATN
ncbi:MAG: hypothetical protein FD128_1778 [Hyphomonadaceae bacterium]|nr:MAG: hypothetical protein FD128_1778 [Hyphomonadaceae bacterium]